MDDESSQQPSCYFSLLVESHDSLIGTQDLQEYRCEIISTTILLFFSLHLESWCCPFVWLSTIYIFCLIIYYIYIVLRSPSWTTVTTGFGFYIWPRVPSWESQRDQGLHCKLFGFSKLQVLDLVMISAKNAHCQPMESWLSWFGQSALLGCWFVGLQSG
jgi:hypothetical protein